jgi:predicted ATPase
MIVSLCGAQNSGKTTLLNDMKTLGFNAIEKNHARDALTQWNTTLEEVYTDPNKTVLFQEHILREKIECERDFVDSEDLYLVDRSYIDLYVYALINLGRLNSFNGFINEYRVNCLEASKNHYATFYIFPHNNPIEKDGVRGVNKHYASMVNTVMYDECINFYNNSNFLFFNIKDSDKLKRANILCEWLKNV